MLPRADTEGVTRVTSYPPSPHTHHQLCHPLTKGQFCKYNGVKLCFKKEEKPKLESSSVSQGGGAGGKLPPDGFDREDQLNPPGWKREKLRKEERERKGEKGKEEE